MLTKSLAVALLAGVPPKFGLYSAMIPPLIYVFFGTSAWLGIGPSSLLGLLTGMSDGLDLIGLCSKLIGVSKLF